MNFKLEAKILAKTVDQFPIFPVVDKNSQIASMATHNQLGDTLKSLVAIMFLPRKLGSFKEWETSHATGGKFYP